MKITKQIKNILVINLAFIGDVILVTPVTRALKKEYPDASLTMLTVPLTKAVAQMNPYVDDVLVYDKKKQDKGLKGMFAVAKRLRKKNFDLAVCMNFAVRGAVVAWLAGIKYRAGYDAQHAGLFLTHVISSDRGRVQHETENHLCILRALGVSEQQDSSLVFSLPETAKFSLQEKLVVQEKSFMVFCPFGNHFRRSFSIGKAQDIVRTLMGTIPVYLIGGAKEKSDLQEIAAKAGLPEENILAGVLNLQELAVFISGAKVLLTVDTGPLHIAQAVNTPVAALFGPSNPVVWGPRGKDDLLFFEKTECSPCFSQGDCQAGENKCMEQFSADEIAGGVLNLLDKIDGRNTVSLKRVEK